MYNPIEGTGDGSAPVVNLTWPFLSRDHIKATVDDVAVEITWTGSSQVTFSAEVAAGATWKVARVTPKDILLVDYSDGAVLLAEDLDTVGQQLLYAQQEVLSQVSDLEDLDLTEVLSRVTLVEAGLESVDGDIAALNSGKADATHSHEITDIAGLQAALDATLDAADILGGANVTVTDNGDGTVTIAAAGGGGGGATLADGDYGDVAVSSLGTVMTVQTVGGAAVAAATHDHDDRYYTETEVDGLLLGKSDTGHTHDSRYYTETEVDGLLAAKANAGHTHDDRYYTETEVDGLLDEKTDAFTTVGSFSSDHTIADADNGKYLKGTGSVTLDVTLDGTPTAGLSVIIVNRSSQTMNFAAAGGMYLNSATSTSTSGAVAPGGSVVLFHEGAGVWAAKGDIT